MDSQSRSQLATDLLAGLKQGVVLAAAALVMILPPAGQAVSHASVSTVADPERVAAFRGADFGAHAPTDDARLIADWATDSGDSRGLPFAILDKRDARLYVFTAEGRLIDASPVLLGAAPGDDSVPDIGSRPMALVRPEERTTPAGRFVSAPGKNASDEDVVWVDHGAAVSMHRVRLVDPKERRLERLASPDPAERRISYGCINVPVAFFESVVWPILGIGRAVVYVLPEQRAIGDVFAGAYSAQGRPAPRPPALARL